MKFITPKNIDRRTWWRYDYENWIDGFCESVYDGIQEDFNIYDRNTIDCIVEQYWAEENKWA